GASPDFLVDDSGGGEIKSPESSEVHLATLLHGLPPEHIEQIQGGLWVTGRQWWDFVSFHPKFPPEHRLYIQRVPRNDEYIVNLEAACLQLEADVQAILSQLNQRAA
ncbi:exonuclease, partial [Patescibacteria group bacterium]|nr:exonuclease [Patescibacteria group bacterium]